MKSNHIKRSIFITAGILALSLIGMAQNFDPFAQDSLSVSSSRANPIRSSARDQGNKTASATSATLRAQSLSEERRGHSDTPWKRIIYRELNLDSVANAPLYYPPRPTSNGRKNLFSILFGLINRGELAAYEYEDLGVENYDDTKKIRFEEFLDRFGIMYTQEKRPVQGSDIVVLDADIPSEWVKSYYIKEIHYFNPLTSTVEVAIESLCPILTEEVDLEGVVKIPLFWVKYQALKPYLIQNYVMLSDYNNAELGTLDDYFQLSSYLGDIVRVENLRGRSIEQGKNSPEEIAQERHQIEKELSSFKEKVYGVSYTESTSKEEKAVEEKEDSQEKVQESPKKRKTESTARARRSQSLKKEEPKKSASRSVRNRF